MKKTIRSECEGIIGTLLALALTFLFHVPPARACDVELFTQTQEKVIELTTRCQSSTERAEKARIEYQALRDRYRNASKTKKKRIKPKLDEAKERLEANRLRAKTICGSLSKKASQLNELAEACIDVFSPPDSGGQEPGTPPAVEDTLPDTEIDPEAPLDSKVAELVQAFSVRGYEISLHGDPSSLSTTIFDVTISGYRFLFYPNGLIWYPAGDLFLIRDYFDSSIFRAVKFTSKAAREFITGSILENVPGAIAVSGENVFLIYKLPSAPTVGFGVLKTGDGLEYIVYPQDYEAVIRWLFPQAYLLELLKYQIISNLLSAHFYTAIQITSNFPGSGTTFEYIY